MTETARILAAAMLALSAACAAGSGPTLDPAVALITRADFYESGSLSTPKRASALWAIQQRCLGKFEAAHIEQYDGEFGPKPAFVLAEAPATARLIWNDARVSAYRPNQGTLYGAACTGTLVSEDLLLTAAHCIQVAPNENNNGWTPRRQTSGGEIAIPPEEIGLLLDAQFNYQLDPNGRPRDVVTFAVEEVVEHGINANGTPGIDYALLRLSPLADGRKAGDLFTPANWDSSDAAYDLARMLTVIQHPLGDFKKIHAGGTKKFPDAEKRQELRYENIDTLASSSGSGIIDQEGRLVGVHIFGGCQEAVKYNAGVSLVAIRNRSAYFSRPR